MQPFVSSWFNALTITNTVYNTTKKSLAIIKKRSASGIKSADFSDSDCRKNSWPPLSIVWKVNDPPYMHSLKSGDPPPIFCHPTLRWNLWTVPKRRVKTFLLSNSLLNDLNEEKKSVGSSSVAFKLVKRAKTDFTCGEAYKNVQYRVGCPSSSPARISAHGGRGPGKPAWPEHFLKLAALIINELSLFG